MLLKHSYYRVQDKHQLARHHDVASSSELSPVQRVVGCLLFDSIKPSSSYFCLAGCAPSPECRQGRSSRRIHTSREKKIPFAHRKRPEEVK